MLSEQNKIKLIDFFRICSKCETLKSWKGFHKCKKGRFGINLICKVCNCADRKEYYIKNREKCNKHTQKWAKANPEKRKKTDQRYRKKHPDKIRKLFQEWCKKNPDKKNQIDMRWRKNNYGKYLKYMSRWKKEKRNSNPKFKLNNNMATAIWQSLKGNKNGRKWESLVGYTLNKLKKHLEKQFAEGMSWKNYGKRGWVIDHKIPQSVFNFTKPEHRDFKKCWALKNLQPLWSETNRQKSAKLTKHFQPSLLI